MTYKGCVEIVMPENYIALFDAPQETEAREIIRCADAGIEEAAHCIANGQELAAVQVGVSDRLKSSIVNDAFYKIFVHAKKFTISDACISCGKCVQNCVMNNIRLVDGKPVWEDHCTHCMACICGCPTEAIEYGKSSKGKPRYQCPDMK